MVTATVDGPTVACALETYWCRARAALAGGLDEHHEHPISLGGSTADGLLTLCVQHHRRVHAGIRAMVEHVRAGGAVSEVRFVRRYTAAEMDLATGAVTAWLAAGQPSIAGWPCPAAATR